MGATFDITVESGGSFTIEVVDAGGDFTIETPSLAASFTIEAANVGPQGPAGPAGVVSATYPLSLVSQNLSIDLTTYATKTYVTSQGYITSSALTPYLLSSTAASTYAPIASPTFTGEPHAPTPILIAADTKVATAEFVKSQGYITSAALSGYATESYVTSQGYITSAALSPYLTSATAASTYQTISGMSSYLTTSSAASTYLTQSNAASTYQTQSGMSAYLTTSSAASTYLTQSNAASTYAPIAAGVPTGGTTGQALVKSSNSNYATSWTTLQLGDRYLTSSTTSLTISNATKTLTVGTGLAYTTQQTVVIAYDATNHMHGTVTSYNSGTGVMVVDVSQKSGSGTYASWTVNVAGITSVPAWGDITGTLSNQTDLQSALDAKLAVTTAASTYQTISGMASYALLSGPTFTGVPKAPTAATSDNTTQIATTAFVKAQGYLTTNAVSSVAGKTGAVTLASTDITDFSTAVPAAVPSASTSTAGKVQLATDTQATSWTSTTTAVTPSNLLAYRNRTNSHGYLNEAWSATTSGTGATTNQNFGSKVVSAPTSAVGYSALYDGWQLARLGGSANDGFDWTAKIDFVFRISRQLGTADSNSLFRVLCGKSTVGYTVGDLANKGIGVRCVNGAALQLQVHNGTTLTNVTSTYTPTTQVTFNVRIYSDGAGNVTLFVNGSQVATTSAGPTGAQVGGGNGLAAEVENIGILTGTRAIIHISDYQVTID